MTYQDPKKEILEQVVKEVTNYGYNDEYGYYDNWADGVRPILEFSLDKYAKEYTLGILDEIQNKGSGGGSWRRVIEQIKEKIK